MNQDADSLNDLGPSASRSSSPPAHLRRRAPSSVDQEEEEEEEEEDRLAHSLANAKPVVFTRDKGLGRNDDTPARNVNSNGIARAPISPTRARLGPFSMPLDFPITLPTTNSESHMETADPHGQTAAHTSSFDYISLVATFQTSPFSYRPPYECVALLAPAFQDTADLPAPVHLAVIRARIMHYCYLVDCLSAAKSHLYSTNETTLRLLELLKEATTLPPMHPDEPDNRPQRILDHGVPLTNALDIEQFLNEWWIEASDKLNKAYTETTCILSGLLREHKLLEGRVTDNEMKEISESEPTWAEEAQDVKVERHLGGWVRAEIPKIPVGEEYIIGLAGKLEYEAKIASGSVKRFQALVRAEAEAAAGIEQDSESENKRELGKSVREGLKGMFDSLGKRLPRKDKEQVQRDQLQVRFDDEVQDNTPIRRRLGSLSGLERHLNSLRLGRRRSDSSGDANGVDNQDEGSAADNEAADQAKHSNRTKRRFLSRSNGTGTGTDSFGSSATRSRSWRGKPRRVEIDPDDTWAQTPPAVEVVENGEERERLRVAVDGSGYVRPQFHYPYEEEQDDRLRVPWPCPGPVPDQYRATFSASPSPPRPRLIPRVPVPLALPLELTVEDSRRPAQEDDLGRSSTWIPRAQTPLVFDNASDGRTSLTPPASPVPSSQAEPREPPLPKFKSDIEPRRELWGLDENPPDQLTARARWPSLPAIGTYPARYANHRKVQDILGWREEMVKADEQVGRDGSTGEREEGNVGGKDRKRSGAARKARAAVAKRFVRGLRA